MWIECKRKPDKKYYVSVFIKSIYCINPSDITFLIDTGAGTTQLNWYAATRIGLVTKGFLRYDGEYRGVGGKRYPADKLTNVELIFKSTNDKYSIKLEKLSIMRKTEDNKNLPLMASLLGMDALEHFDIFFRKDKAYLKPH